LEILSSFPKKEMNIKVGGNFVPDNQDTEFALFGVWTLEIWCRQGRAANQENLDEADFMENHVPFSPKEDLVQGKVEHASRLHKGKNTLPWAPKEGGSIHPFIRVRPTRRRSTQRKPPAAASPQSRLGDGLGLP
jgi:hypothetical protein